MDTLICTRDTKIVASDMLPVLNYYKMLLLHAVGSLPVITASWIWLSANLSHIEASSKGVENSWPLQICPNF